MTLDEMAWTAREAALLALCKMLTEALQVAKRLGEDGIIEHVNASLYTCGEKLGRSIMDESKPRPASEEGK